MNGAKVLGIDIGGTNLRMGLVLSLIHISSSGIITWISYCRRPSG